MTQSLQCGLAAAWVNRRTRTSPKRDTDFHQHDLQRTVTLQYARTVSVSFLM